MASIDESAELKRVLLFKKLNLKFILRIYKNKLEKFEENGDDNWHESAPNARGCE